MIRNLQVATAGEDEEDLRVVDGQQRTARRDDEHGCALNTTGSSLLRLEKIRRKKKGVNKYILVSEVPRDKNTGVSSLLSGG